MEELRSQMHQIYGNVAAFKYAIRIVRESEATGQELLFDPRELVK